MINISTPNGFTKSVTNLDSIQKNEIMSEVKNSIDDSDLIVISKLNNLRASLCQEKLNVSYIKQQIEELSSFNQSQNYAYLTSLLCPERSRGSKMPSQIPVPSCSFQLHNSITLTTNASGNVAFVMNPCFLASESIIGSSVTIGETSYNIRNFVTSAWVNNNDTLTGSAEDNNWVPVNFFQTLPDVYDQYRLVSASLVIRYIGRLDETRGQIGGAIFYDELPTMGGQVQPGSGQVANTGSPYLSKYGIFDYALDAFYSKTNMTLEGVRMLYFPIDNSYEEYTKVMNDSILAVEDGLVDGKVVFNPSRDYYKGVFNWFFWAQGCPSATACFKADIYCNFECLPNARFLNYMPVSINNVYIPVDKRKEWIMSIQQHPIMKANEDITGEVGIPNIFIKMIRKFKNGLPGFDRLRACGLIGAIPGLKPGLALAGNMIQQSMQIDNYC